MLKIVDRENDKVIVKYSNNKGVVFGFQTHQVKKGVGKVETLGVDTTKIGDFLSLREARESIGRVINHPD